MRIALRIVVGGCMSLPTLDEVIEIIKAGDKKRGRELLANVIQADLENEKAWLWMSGVAETDEERRKYLNRVLEINPDNTAAKRGLAKLDKMGGASPVSSQPSAGETEARPATSLSARLAALQQEPAAQPEPPLTANQTTDSQADSPPPGEPLPQPAAPEPPPLTVPDEPSLPAMDETVPDFQEESAEARDDQTPPTEDTEPEPPIEPPGEDVTAPETPVEQDSPRQKASALPASIQRLSQYWETERGKIVISAGAVGLLLACTACVVCGLVFRPVSGEIPPTLAAIVGTETPMPTFTPVPPTSTPTPTLTPTPTDTPTITPSPTSTQVVFDTPTVTATPTRTSTPVPLPQVVIVSVNDFEEYVDIQNTGNAPQDLAGWRLVSEREGQECVLTSVIQPGQSLRIWALLINADQEGLNCGFDQEIWHDTEPDAAILYNADRVEVSRLE